MEQPSKSGGEWVEVRCPSPTCVSADSGGKVLFEGKANMVAKRANGGKLVVLGMPLMAVCRCGYVWLNPELPIFDGMAQLMALAMDAAEKRVDEQRQRGCLRRPEAA